MDDASPGNSNGRVLIVNADDFGHSRSVNAGVIKAHERGIVTSASLMVRRPAAEEAAAYARARPDLGLGLHLDLGEWIPRDRRWEAAYELADLEDYEAVTAEVRAQLAKFRELLGRDPSHIDSHQHIHTHVEPDVGVAFGWMARQLGVPLRHRSPDIDYRGDLYGRTSDGDVLEAIGVDNLIEILRGLKPGVTELACHPGEGEDLDPLYSEEREQELRILCDPRVRETIESERIELRSFADLPHAGRGAV